MHGLQHRNELNEESHQRLEKLHAIRDSILNGFEGFHLLYQPVVDSETEQMTGAEALLRWKNDLYGTVYPDQFIPILESDPLFPELGEWIIRESVLAARQILAGHPGFIVNVNISYSQLEKPDFADRVFRILDETGYPPENLCLEMTERCRLLDVGLLKNYDEHYVGSLIYNLSMFSANNDYEQTAIYRTYFAVSETVRKLADSLSRYEQELQKMRKDAENRDRQQKEIRVRAAKAKQEYDQTKAIYDVEFERDKQELANLRAKTDAEADKVEGRLLERYKAIKQHCTPPMARLVDGQCSGCFMSLPSATLLRLSSGEDIVECDNCGRILYVEK